MITRWSWDTPYFPFLSFLQQYSLLWLAFRALICLIFVARHINGTKRSEDHFCGCTVLQGSLGIPWESFGNMDGEYSNKCSWTFSAYAVLGYENVANIPFICKTLDSWTRLPFSVWVTVHHCNISNQIREKASRKACRKGSLDRSLAWSFQLLDLTFTLVCIYLNSTDDGNKLIFFL